MALSSVRVLSVIPPMTQLNTPYPSTAYLTGFLRSQGINATQEDLALALVLRLLSSDGLTSVRERILLIDEQQRTTGVKRFHQQFEQYHTTIDRTISFLQGKDATLAHRIAGRHFLPEGSRFDSLDVYVADEEFSDDPMAWAFGMLGVQDRARHFATLYLVIWLMSCAKLLIHDSNLSATQNRWPRVSPRSILSQKHWLLL